jgi:nucleoside-diphosphate-sugar epimerase
MQSGKIFITGASGFVGRHLTEKLLGYGYQVLVLVRKTSNTKLLDTLNVAKIVADLTEPEIYGKYLDGVQAVYHLAAEVSDWAPHNTYVMSNVEGTKRLLSVVKDKRISNFIYLSTIDVLERAGELREDLAYSNSSLGYIQTKTAAEQFVLNFCIANNLNCTVLRPAWVYGPGDTTLLPEIVKQIKIKTVLLIGKKSTYIPLVYVKNLVDVLLKILTHKFESKMNIFLVADNEKVTWSDFVEMISKEMNAPIKIVYIPSKVAYFLGICFELWWKIFSKKSRPLITRTSAEMLSESLVVDNSKIVHELDYRSAISLNDGIRESLAWMFPDKFERRYYSNGQ